MKNLRFEMIKLLRSRFVMLVAALLLVGNAFAAYTVCDPEHDAPSENYAEGVARLIDDSRHRYENEKLKDAFAARYYKQITEKYSLLDTEGDPQPVFGWGRYLSYRYNDLFLYACCAFCAAFSFRREKETGEMTSLYTMRHGRLRYAAVKLASAVIFSAAFTVLFCASSLFAVWAKSGYQPFYGAGARIQDLKTFIYAPNAATVGEAVLTSFLYKIPICIAASFFAGAVSYLFNSGAISIVASALQLYVSYRLDVKGYVDKNAFGRNCNTFAAMRPSCVYGEFRCINVFGFAVPAYVVNVAVPVLLAVLLGAAFIFMHLNRAGVRIRIRLPKINITRKEKPASPHGLFRYEIQKLTKSRLTVAVIFVLFLSRIAVSLLGIRGYSYDDRVYRSYCERWQGPVTEQTYAEYAEETKKIGEGYKAYVAIIYGGKYDGDDPIGASDYYVAHFKGFEKFDQKLSRITQYKQEGVEIPVVYEGGYERFLGAGADIFLILAIVYVCTYLSTYDGVNGMTDVVKATYSAGKKLTAVKIGTVFTVASVMYAAFTLVSYLTVFLVCGMKMPFYPVYVLPGYEIRGGMTLGAYLILTLLLRYAGTLLLCLFSCGISSLFKNQITAMAVSAGVYIIPAFLQKGAEAASRFIDPALMLDGSGFLLLGTGRGAAVSAAICAALPLLMFIPYLLKQRKK